MAPPAAGAPASTDWSCMHIMSLEHYEYVFDWAAVIGISTINPLDGEAYGLRCFAIPKGYSTHAGVRGHFLINTNQAGGTRHAETITLPALVKFADASLPDSLALAFKLAENKKLYLQNIKLPLLASKDKDGKETWQTDNRPVLSKLETIASFSSVENRDGCALGKQLDKWLPKHCATFKILNLTTLLKCRDWCSTGQYEKNLKVIMDATELRVRKLAKQSAGGRSVNQPTNTSAGCEQAKAVEMQHLAMKLELVKEAGVQLLVAAPFYNRPISNRLVHVLLKPYEEGKAIDTEGIEEILARDTGDHRKSLLGILKRGDLLKLLSQGATAPIPFASPMLVKKSASRIDDEDEPPPPAAAEEAASTSNAAVQDLDDEFARVASEDDVEEGEEGEDEPQLISKAAGKKPPARRSKRAKDSVAAAKTAAAAASAAAIPIDVDEPRPKRAYQRTGLHSKDPETAALARAKLASGDATPTLRTPAASTTSAGSAKSASMELAEIAKLKAHNSELKAELKIKEAEITALRFRVESAGHEKALAVSNAELKGQLNLSQLTEEAYEKGFSRAMKNFKDVKALISDA